MTTPQALFHVFRGVAMMGSSVTLSPLEGVSEAHLKSLCKILWGWDYCAQCTTGETCLTPQCPWWTSEKLEPFFNFYRNATFWSIPEMLADGHYALRSHEDLFRIIQLLKEKADVPRSTLMEEHFSSYGQDGAPDPTDQHRAFNLAVKIMTMVNCSVEGQSLDLWEEGLEPIVWRGDKSLQEFMVSAFPRRDHSSLNDTEGSSDIKSQITAIRLQKICGLKFEATDDLRYHLNIDRKTGVVRLFHHTTFLKQHLLATRENPVIRSTSASTIHDFIPRQLALETLDSLQKILFPVDVESRKLFNTLVTKNGFDPDCSQFDYSDYRHDTEEETKYCYWGSRLMDLYYELEEPRPRGRIQGFLELKCKARHVMMATIAAVLITVVLGTLTLAVGVFQAWVAYQQWKIR